MSTQTERWMKTEQAAEYLSVSTSYLYNQGSEIGIPRVKLGNGYRYRMSDLDAWMLGKSNVQNDDTNL
jgi:excisionase family DNA binding protein